MVTLRPAQPDDEDFLYSLYRSVRQDDLAGLDWDTPEREALLRMQFQAQEMSYRPQGRDTRHDIICLNGQPVGRLITARHGNELRGVDIALLPEHRNKGIGTALIKGMLSEAWQEGKAVRFHVLANNPAMRLYTRLGFSIAGETGTHFFMESERH